MRWTGRVLAFCLVILMSSDCIAQEFVHTDEAIPFPKKVVTANGTSLLLNGIGYRKVTIFNIRVYAAGLYVPSIIEEPERIITSTQDKRLLIKFMHDVSIEDMQDAFISNFTDNNPDTPYKSKLEEFAQKLPEIVEGDILQIDWNAQGVEASINNRIVARDSDIDFGRGVLRIWFGMSPPNGSLQRNMLTAHPK